MDSVGNTCNGVVCLDSKPNKAKYYYIFGIAIVCAVLIIVGANQFQQAHFLKNVKEGGILVKISNSSVDKASPTISAYNSSLQKKWNNVEITNYAKRINEQSQISSQESTTGACSGIHDDVKYHNICKDSAGYQNTAYTGGLTYDGRADYVNEALYYKGGVLSNNHINLSPKMISAFSNFTNSSDPSTEFHIVHKNTWIGYKFVVRSIYNNTVDVTEDKPLVLHYNMVIAGLR